MSYVVEFAENVHSTFRATSGFCHNLQHVMRGAVKNLSQTCLLTDDPALLARYQRIFTALQHLLDTNTIMSECTITQSDTFTMRESAADFLAEVALSEHGGSGGSGSTRRHYNASSSNFAIASSSSFKSSDSAAEQTFESFDKVAAENLSAILTPELITQMTDVYNAAVVAQQLEANLKVLSPKVKKYAKNKKEEKLREAEAAEAALNEELSKAKATLKEKLDTAFPEVYKRVLRQYIDICNSLLTAMVTSSEIWQTNEELNTIRPTTAPLVADQLRVSAPASNHNSSSRRDGSVALTVDALEVHEALEEVLHERDHHHSVSDSGSAQARQRQDRLHTLLSPASQEHNVTESNAQAESPEAQGGTVSTSNRTPPQPSSTPSSTQQVPTPATRASPLSSAVASTVAPPLPTAAAPSGVSAAAASPPSFSSTRTSMRATSIPYGTAASPHFNTPADLDISPFGQTLAGHESEPVSPSPASSPHARFPFWFRYHYFDQLANSTERLAIAFALYLDYCKRLARKAEYTIPLPIKKHMDRMHMEFGTGRYARHKRELDAVLKEIFKYRKNLEIMETHVRAAREAEAHVQKHTAAKNKRGLAKWNAKLTAANDSIEQLRLDVFGRGAEEMVQFYDRLIQCIRSSMSDLVITLGGTPP